MLSKETLSRTDQRCFLRWTLWPVGLYLLGMVINRYSIFFFPFTLTLVQYIVLKERAGNRQPALWFGVLLLYGISLWCIRLPVWIKQPAGEFVWVVYYYLCQCVAEVLLFFMFASFRWAWYTCFNLLACGIWLLF